jgi:hypothetical protein
VQLLVDMEAAANDRDDQHDAEPQSRTNEPTRECCHNRKSADYTDYTD